MTAAFQSGSNTYVPQFDASGKLIVGFSRNIQDFPINKYVTITQVQRNTGYYLKITAEQAARVINSNLADMVWHDGQDAPAHNDGTESFDFVKFETTRRQTGFRLGWLARDQADWQILASHAAINAQRMMTARTQLVATEITTSANYNGNTATATVAGGGFWSAGTATSPIIKKSLNYAMRAVGKATIGVVQHKDMVLVVSPTVASAMAESQELHAYLKESPFALAQIRGDAPNCNIAWGLPETLYGVNLVVEDAVKVTTAKKASSTTRSYVIDENMACLLARPGGLTSQEGGVSFSTVHLFMKEEMNVESMDDPNNRRVVGRVTEDYSVDMVASASGYLFTAVLS